MAYSGTLHYIRTLWRHGAYLRILIHFSLSHPLWEVEICSLKVYLSLWCENFWILNEKENKKAANIYVHITFLLAPKESSLLLVYTSFLPSFLSLFFYNFIPFSHFSFLNFSPFLPILFIKNQKSSDFSYLDSMLIDARAELLWI